MSEHEYAGTALIVTCENDQLANEFIQVCFDNKVQTIRAVGSLAEVEPKTAAVVLFYGSCCIKKVHFVKWVSAVRAYKALPTSDGFLGFTVVVRDAPDEEIELLKASGAGVIHLSQLDGLSEESEPPTAEDVYRVMGRIAPLLFQFRPRSEEVEASATAESVH